MSSRRDKDLPQSEQQKRAKARVDKHNAAQRAARPRLVANRPTQRSGRQPPKADPKPPRSQR